MRIYTRTGDKGQTGLFGGSRVEKDAARVEAFGTVDELNAVLGFVRAQGLPDALDSLMERLQRELFELGAALANPAVAQSPRIGPEHVTALEADLDRYMADLPPFGDFLLPAGTPAASAFHLARTVCRRAERRLVTAMRECREPIAPVLLAYLNRLGDLLFILARHMNQAAGQDETTWPRRK